MKSVALVFVLLFAATSTVMAHNEVYANMLGTEKPAAAEQAAIEPSKEQEKAEKASVKMIDELTERLHLKRRKLWNKEAEEKDAVSLK